MSLLEQDKTQLSVSEVENKLEDKASTKMSEGSV